jgi:hypothetical protein
MEEAEKPHNELHHEKAQGARALFPCPRCPAPAQLVRALARAGPGPAINAEHARLGQCPHSPHRTLTRRRPPLRAPLLFSGRACG